MDIKNSARPKLSGAAIFKNLAFFLFTFTSMFFSINMWYELGQELKEKIAFVCLSIGIDSLKTYCIIIANSLREAADGILLKLKYSTAFKDRKIWQNSLSTESPDTLSIVLKKKKSQRNHFAMYIIAATTSIAAITGFGLVAVDRYSKSHTAELISTTSEQELLQKDIAGLEADIAANEESIKQTQASIGETRAQITALDPEIKGYAWYREQYQKKIDKYNAEIDAYRDENKASREEIKSINGKIRELVKLDGTISEEDKETGKRASMFELMAKAIGMDNPTTLMLIMMILAAFVNELGIIVTSPEFELKDKKLETQEPSPLDPQPPKIRRLYNRRPKNDKEESKNEISRRDELQSSSLNGPTELPPEISPSPDKIEVSENKDEKNKSEPNSSEEKEEGLAEGKREDAMAPLPGDASTGYALEEVPEEPVPRPIQSPAEKFIHALFSNGTKPYLKDKREAAKEAGLDLIEATRIFDILAKTKGNKGYTLIEFRGSQWYPNFTSEVIIAYLEKLKRATVKE